MQQYLLAVTPLGQRVGQKCFQIGDRYCIYRDFELIQKWIWIWMNVNDFLINASQSHNYFHMWEHTHVCPLHREKRCWSECLSLICKCAKNTMGKRCSPTSEVTESQLFFALYFFAARTIFFQGTANGLQRRLSTMEGENCANGLDQTWGLGETKLKLDARRKEI